MSIPRLEAEGSNHELGYKHGQEFKSRIRVFSQSVLDRAPPNSRDALVSFARGYLPFLERTSPHLLEEIRGISEGSEVPFDEIMALNLAPDFGGIEDGCTTFAMSHNIMDDGDALVAQNADFSPETDDYTVLLQLSLPSGLRIATLTEAGTVGTAGMNSEGLVRVGNGLYLGGKPEAGQPYHFLRRRMLEQVSVEGALKVAREKPRSQQSGHLLADKEGEILYAEMLAQDDRILKPNNGWIAHTNHLIHQDYRALEKGIVRDSPARLATISKLLAQDSKHELNEAKGFLRNHDNYPYSICRHEESGDKLGMGWKTNASIILRPGTNMLYVCHGNPCTGEFAPIHL